MHNETVIGFGFSQGREIIRKRLFVYLILTYLQAS